MLFFGFFLAVNLRLFRHNPGLLQERLRLGTSDQEGWDKVLFPVLLVFPFVWLIFMSLDAVRFHWLPVPAWLQLTWGDTYRFHELREFSIAVDQTLSCVIVYGTFTEKTKP